MGFISDFADLGMVLPLASLIALSLAAVGKRREALAWFLAVTGTLGTIVLLKLLVFIVIGPETGDGLGSPSGHTAAGTVVYAGLLTLIGERFAPQVPTALLASVAFGLLFGFSRLTPGVHTVPDVLVGAAVGLAGVLVMARLAGPRRRDTPAGGLAVVATVALVGMATFHGQRIFAEGELRSIAAQIQSIGDP